MDTYDKGTDVPLQSGKVVNLAEVAMDRNQELRAKVLQLEESLDRARAWSRRWKRFSVTQHAKYTDTALTIMEGQEVLVTLMLSLEGFIQTETEITVKDGETSLVISDVQKLLEFSRVVAGIRTAVSENIEILARSFPKGRIESRHNPLSLA